MQNAFDAIGWMRWGNKYQRITVNKPAEFTIRNAESLTSEFKTAMDAKLPSPYLNNNFLEGVTPLSLTPTTFDRPFSERTSILSPFLYMSTTSHILSKP